MTPVTKQEIVTMIIRAAEKAKKNLLVETNAWMNRKRNPSPHIDKRTIQVLDADLFIQALEEDMK